MNPLFRHWDRWGIAEDGRCAAPMIPLLIVRCRRTAETRGSLTCRNCARPTLPLCRRHLRGMGKVALAVRMRCPYCGSEVIPTTEKLGQVDD